jgi:hypothetical protein
MRFKKFFLLAALPLALLASGCMDKQTEAYKDSGVSARNNTPAQVIEMPDGFSNLSAKCDGPNMVYVIFHNNNNYGSVAVAPNDPRCK